MYSKARPGRIVAEGLSYKTNTDNQKEGTKLSAGPPVAVLGTELNLRRLM
jgi:hypothetical protein